jgi:hypothetical protein
MDILQISTGEKHLEIVRDGQSVGELVFNPNDALIAEKFYRVIEKLNTKEKELQELSRQIDARITTDGNGLPTNTEEIIDFAKQAHTALCEEYDYLFGAGTSKLIFGEFVPVNEAGFKVHEQFIHGFAPYFEKARAEKIKKYIPARQKRVRK